MTLPENYCSSKALPKTPGKYYPVLRGNLDGLAQLPASFP